MAGIKEISRLSKAWISVIIGLVLPLVVVLISLTRSLSTVTYASAFASVILLYLSFMYWEFGDQLANMGNKVESLLENTATVIPVREPNFYERFDEDSKEAKKHVWITYFDNKSPLDTHDSDKKEYYEQVGQTIRKKSDQGVEFKRIVRAVPQVEDWVDQLIEERQGISRYSLACVPDDQPELRSNSHVSVQLIDDDITYFVAVGEQQESDEPRDMFVRSVELNDQWSRYYQRLWNESFEVVRRGQVQPDEVESFRQHLRSLEDGTDGE
ncbi:hypothetical protein ACKVMT_13860 [Halobacteriales archaeon Cl-PHB]